jgi:hypothetical protein
LSCNIVCFDGTAFGILNYCQLLQYQLKKNVYKVIQSVFGLLK